jgi:hypothetical protein
MIVLALRPDALRGLSRTSSSPGTACCREPGGLASGGQAGQRPRCAIPHKCLDLEP